MAHRGHRWLSSGTNTGKLTNGVWKIIDNHIGQATVAKSIDPTLRYKELKDFLYSKTRLVCLTGAGISTQSGIPDYRGPQGSYKKGHKPMNHHDFVSTEASRQR
jgi:hypothetical protein